MVFHSKGSTFLACLPHIPVADYLQHFLQFWEEITTNKGALEIVSQGDSLELLQCPPFKGLQPTNPPQRYVSSMAEEVDTWS
jgi:hypothetical protein